jgi:deoxyadenosine/deoxycytidine kinase
MVSENQNIFILEGNIGAGKSTFLALIKEALPVQIVYEPVAQWQNVGAGENVLKKFYQDTQRWAYTFQSYAFITRIIEQKEYAKINTFDVQVLERSVYSDRYCFAKNCYEMGTMSSLEWSLYQQWFEWLVGNYVARPTGFIYLQTNPTICYERLTKRARSEEVGVSFEYLRLLHEKHEAWLIEKKDILSALHDVPVLVLNCDEDFENNLEVMNRFKDQIKNFINKHSFKQAASLIATTSKQGEL